MPRLNEKETRPRFRPRRFRPRVIDIDDVTSSTELTDDESTDPAVEVGDKVIVSFDDNPNRHVVLTVTEDNTDLLNGIVSASNPPGQEFLGAYAEDEISLDWNGKQRRATILEIEKSRLERRGAKATSTERSRSHAGDDGLSKQASPTKGTPTSDTKKTSSSQNSPNRAPVQQVLLPEPKLETDGQPTDDELAKYREYEQAMSQHGIACRPLNEWIESYRQQQKRS